MDSNIDQLCLCNIIAHETNLALLHVCACFTYIIITQIRGTKRASVFPVGFAGGLKFEGPVCSENGTAVKWHVSWAPERYAYN